MAITLRKAQRSKAKLRIGIAAPSGFGKTYSSLLLAKGLCDSFEKVCVIDTENGSADFYQHLGDFNVIPLSAPYSPERYIEAIEAAEQAGMEVIIIDSMTHEWAGVGGCLEIQEKLGGKYQDWGKVKPRHRKFLDKILQSSAHVICTVRSKQDYAMNQDNGKTKIEKVGMKQITEDGFEYELTVSFDIINKAHLATVSKDRTEIFDGKPEAIINEETGKVLRSWSENGVESVKPAVEPVKSVDEVIEDMRTCTNLTHLGNIWNKYAVFYKSDREAVEKLTEAKEEAKERLSVK